MKTVSNFNNSQDLLYIFTGILIFDIFIIFLTKYYPKMMGSNLNIWYEKFQMNGVLSDVLSVFLGFVIARWIVTTYFPKDENNVLIFAGILVAVQLIHDLFFAYFIIKPIPKGHNDMIDVFKNYITGGGKILIGDAILMLGAFGIALLLKNKFPNHTIEVLALSVYVLVYILYTKWR